jgi:dUTP pyrophosphatase
MVILINLGNETYTVKRGERIAQLVLAPVVQGTFTESEKLPPSERGSGGFGSTGA